MKRVATRWFGARGRAWLAVSVVVMSVVTGCAEKQSTPGAETPGKLLAQMQEAVERGDREAYLSLVHGEGAPAEVFAAIFDVAQAGRRLSEALESSYGEGSLAHTYETPSGSVTTVGLVPGLGDEPFLVTGQLVVDGADPGRAMVATTWWRDPLMLVQREGRWFVDAEATLTPPGRDDAEPLIEAELRSYEKYLAAVEAARQRVRAGAPSRESVLVRLAEDIGRVAMERMRTIQEERRRRREQNEAAPPLPPIPG